MVIVMARVGEESGKTPFLLSKAGEMMELDVDSAISAASDAFGVLVIVVLGIIVGIIAVGVLSPFSEIFASMGG